MLGPLLALEGRGGMVIPSQGELKVRAKAQAPASGPCVPYPQFLRLL